MSVLIVHGGVNVYPGEDVYEVLKYAAKMGFKSIEYNVLEAVENAIKVLEDDPRFNAGFGSVLNMDGNVEMDAAIMNGATGRSGGVAALQGIKNPISVARKVLEETECVLIAGRGAYKFAVSHGMSKARMIDRLQRKSWKKARRSSGLLKEAFDIFTGKAYNQGSDTVGCIALNSKGELAAGTSTGGSFFKIPGRVGDSPIPGAGLYASERCAVSCSGEGEAFLELSIAKMVDMWSIEIYDPEILSNRAVEELTRRGRKGGVIVLLKDGRYSMAHNCTSFPVAGYCDNGYIHL